MSAPCPNCGSRRNPAGVTTCQVCKKPLPVTSVQPVKASNLRTPSAQPPSLVSTNGRRYSISLGGDTYIGRQACAIMLSDPQVSPRHARLFIAASAVQIEPVGQSRLLINGKPISSVQTLNPNDCITIGSTNFTFLAGSVQLPNTPLTISPTAQTTIVSNPQAISIGPQHNADLEGEVRYVEGPFMEEPDPTLGRAMARAAGILLTFWKPGFGWLLGEHRQVPVRYLRIEDTSGQLRVVKMKGEVITGMISTGDHLLFWGKWNSGSLIMIKGHNLTTGSDVYLRQ